MIATIRPATVDEYERLAPIASLGESEPVTPESLVEDDQAGVDAITVRLIAEVGSEVVGYACPYRRPTYDAGRFSVTFAVAEPFRGRGIGSELLRAARAFALGHGGTYFDGKVRDDDADSQAAASRLGFEVIGHSFESALDPRGFAFSSFEPLIARLAAEGIRFEAFSASDRTEAIQRQLHEVNRVTMKDVPGNEGLGDWSFEQFRRDVFEASWFRPEGQILAWCGDAAVGLGAVGEFSPGRFYHMFTGVRREFRGRGIATALKVLTIQAAKGLGAKEIYTHNDSTNASMLSINEKLGYVRRPGWLRLRKRDLNLTEGQ